MIDVFGVGQSTGSLEALPSASVAVDGVPVALAVDRQARFVYVAMRGAHALAAYAIHRETGALTLVPSSELSVPPLSTVARWGSLDISTIALDPSGELAYVAYDYLCDYPDCTGCASVGINAYLYSYAVDARSGRLNRLDSRPVHVGVGSDDLRPPFTSSVQVVVHGRHLYTLDRGRVALIGDADCALAGRPSLRGIEVDRGSGELHDLGTLARGEDSPGRWLGITPSGNYLYIVAGEARRFARDTSTGALERVGNFRAIHAGVFAPSGRLYGVTGTGVGVFTVQPDTGQLTDTGRGAATPDDLDQIALDPRGRYLFAVSRWHSSSGNEEKFVYAFAIDPAAGRLTLAPGAPTPLGAQPSKPGWWGRPLIAVASVP